MVFGQSFGCVLLCSFSSIRWGHKSRFTCALQDQQKPLQVLHGRTHLSETKTRIPKFFELAAKPPMVMPVTITLEIGALPCHDLSVGAFHVTSPRVE